MFGRHCAYGYVLLAENFRREVAPLLTVGSVGVGHSKRSVTSASTASLDIGVEESTLEHSSGASVETQCEVSSAHVRTGGGRPADVVNRPTGERSA